MTLTVTERAYSSNQILKQPALLSSLPFDVERRATLAIIDDRVLDRECLAQGLLANRLDMKVELFGSIFDWKARYGAHQVGILLNTSGRDFRQKHLADEVQSIICEYPDLPIIVVSENCDLRQILIALEIGVKGYIPSAMGLSVCVEAISLALAGGVFISADCLTELQKLLTVAEHKERRRSELFTPREQDVIDALTQGKPNKIIAYELSLRESTVKVHVRNIMQKLKARNRTEVIFKINRLFE